MESQNRYKIGGSSLDIHIIRDEGCVRERELFYHHYCVGLAFVLMRPPVVRTKSCPQGHNNENYMVGLATANEKRELQLMNQQASSSPIVHLLDLINMKTETHSRVSCY